MELEVSWNETLGEPGSPTGARDDRVFSSARDLRGSRCDVGAARPYSWSRGISFERRILAAARLTREAFFLGTASSPVGAVVMISGALGLSA